MGKAKTTAKAKRPAKRRVTQRGDATPEAKATAKEQSAAAEKQFKEADEAIALTADQQEARLRMAALGR